MNLIHNWTPQGPEPAVTVGGGAAAGTEAAQGGLGEGERESYRERKWS